MIQYFQKIFKNGQPWRFKKSHSKENVYISWGLGIDRPFFFSSKFAIKNKSITITGSQITHDHSWPIKYSIVKKSKLGTSIKYCDSVIFYGNYSKGEFIHTFNIPSGTDYQLEVFNHFKYHSTGKIQITQDRNQSPS